MKSVIAAALLALSSAAQANLLLNPGAEMGNLTGWTVGGVSNPTIDDGGFDPGIAPRSGGFHFLGHRGAHGSLTQRVNLAGVPGANQASISFWEQGLDQDPPSDSAYVSLAFLDALGNTLGNAATPVIDAHDGAWRRYEATYALPLDTFYIDYTMHFVRNFGIDLDAFIDDNSLTVQRVPEPANLPLFGLGALAAALMLRRRRQA